MSDETTTKRKPRTRKPKAPPPEAPPPVEPEAALPAEPEAAPEEASAEATPEVAEVPPEPTHEEKILAARELALARLAASSVLGELGPTQVKQTSLVQRLTLRGFLVGGQQSAPHPAIPDLDLSEVLGDPGLVEDLLALAEIVGESVKDMHLSVFELIRIGRALVTVIRRAQKENRPARALVAADHEAEAALVKPRARQGVSVTEKTGKIVVNKFKRDHTPKAKDPEAPRKPLPPPPRAVSPNKVQPGKRYKPVGSPRPAPRVKGTLGVVRGIPGRKATGRRGGVQPLSFDTVIPVVEEEVNPMPVEEIEEIAEPAPMGPIEEGITTSPAESPTPIPKPKNRRNR